MNSTIKSQFLLQPGITYLNFGSFGACVRPVFEEYQKFQLELEREPTQFFISKGPAYLKQSRLALAKYLGCEAEDLVYVTNPSYAVNIVAKSLQLKPGDEILTTDLEYGACDKTWAYYCKKTGATLRRQKVVLPLVSAEKIADDFMRSVNEHTRLIFISQVTSTTALRLPVEEICRRAQDRGIPCFVDGAHGPGLVPVDLGKMGAAMYTGACHKWMLTPKGSAFLYVKKEYQHQLDPLVISWGYDSDKPSSSLFLDYHEGQGTRDYSAFLTVPKAISFMRDYDWTAVAERCHQLVTANAGAFTRLLGSRALAPLTNEFITQMLSIPIRTKDPEKLQQHLFEKYKIEIPVMRHNADVYLRYSINAFNDQADLDKLHEALLLIIKKTDLLQV